MRDTPRIEGRTDASSLRFAIVVSVYHRSITEALRDGAIAALRQAGAVSKGSGIDPVTVVEVPGAFEIPLVARLMAESGSVDAVVCLGCVIRGETPHFDYIASAVSYGIMTASQATRVPITFGILTTNTREEAESRAGDGPSNKGREAALAAVQLANVVGKLPSGR